MTRVVFVLLPGVHLLDPAGPAQVFSKAADFGLPYELAYVAEQMQVVSAQGLPLLATTEWPVLSTDDLLVVPGRRTPACGTGPPSATTSCCGCAPTTRPAARWPACARGPRRSAGRDCRTGAAAPPTTTYRTNWRSVTPGAIVARDVLFTMDDRVVTSAGIASGIDLALHLVAVRHGPALAARVARDMVVHTRRNGHEPQSSAMLRHRAHLDDAVHRVQDLIDERFTEPLPLDTLASYAGASARHPPLRPGHRRPDPPALRADPAAGARRTPPGPRRHHGGRRPRGRLRGRPDAAPPAPAPRPGGESAVLRRAARSAAGTPVRRRRSRCPGRGA